MIKRIKVIQGVGSFVNYHPSTQEQTALEFTKHTIIYANNGYGKSTIANILKSLSENDISKIVQRKSLKDGKPVDIEQEAIIAHSTGESCYKANKWIHPKTSTPKIYVFDQQFISDNLFVHQVEAAHKQKIHVLVIGQEGASLHTDLVEAKENEKRLSGIFEEKKKELIDRQKKTARDDYLLIDSKEVEQIEKGLKEVNTQIEMKIKGEKIRLLTEKSHIPSLNWTFRDLSKAYHSTLENVHAEAEKLVKDHLEKHTKDSTKAESIIRDTIDQIIDVCPFCGKDISDVQSLINAYKSHFDEAHRQLLNVLSETKNDVNTWNPSSEILDIKSKYIEIEGAIRELKNYAEVENNLPPLSFDDAIQEAGRIKKQIQGSLENKIANLSFMPSDSELEILKSHLERINSWSEKVNQVYKLIVKRFDDYLSSVRDVALDELYEKQSRYKAFLGKFSPAETEWCNKYIASEKDYTLAVETTSKCTQSLSAYSKGIFESYQKDINNTLKDLGADFKVDGFSEKVDKKQKQPYADFQLVINETQVPLQARGDNPEFQNTLSEGEKNTLSFAFFINWIKRQGDLKDAIVVFDDPLSSHDDNRKTLTARIIRDISGKLTQTIILTHNKDFLFILADKLKSPKVISLKKDKAHGSKLVPFDLEKERKLDQHQRVDDLERYLEEDYGSVDDAREKIRLCIETALQFKYYRYLKGISTLGKMLDKLLELEKLNPAMLKILRDLNEDSSIPHHGEHEKTPSKELTRDELLPDIKKTLEILEQI